MGGNHIQLHNFLFKFIIYYISRNLAQVWNKTHILILIFLIILMKYEIFHNYEILIFYNSNISNTSMKIKSSFFKSLRKIWRPIIWEYRHTKAGFNMKIWLDEKKKMSPIFRCYMIAERGNLPGIVLKYTGNYFEIDTLRNLKTMTIVLQGNGYLAL